MNGATRPGSVARALAGAALSLAAGGVAEAQTAAQLQRCVVVLQQYKAAPDTLKAPELREALQCANWAVAKPQTQTIFVRPAAPKGE